MQNKSNKKVVVALSGGVDSSVVALLLKQQGYDVIGLHMSDPDNASAEADRQIVQELCEKLGIPCFIEEFTNQMQAVKDYFIAEYKAGRTPNPCVMCNREVKFKPFIDFAKKMNADFFATGHYAIIEREGGNVRLKKAKDANKDQSYFLNQLSLEQLEMAMFPLGELDKSDVRKIAEENGLCTAHKKDSFDVCFVGSKKFKDFMQENYPESAGNIVDIKTGKVVGKHTGISKYTIGQRRGLGVGGTSGGSGDGWFVVDKDIKKNEVFVSQGEGEELLSSGLVATNVNWLCAKPQDKLECYAKFRYRQADEPVCVLMQKNNQIKVIFNKKQRAITLGQYVVLYDEQGYCLGGATINQIIK